MKKKQLSSKVIKSKSIEISNKKVSVIKKHIKKQQPQLYIFLGDNFYVAETKTQRKNYKNFQQQIKIPKTPLKKSRVKSITKPIQNINIQQYVKLLSKQQKQKIFKDLSRQMNQQPIPQLNPNQDKLQLFLQKLQTIKLQLLNHWDQQINLINLDFQNQQIGLQQKNQKVLLLEKIRDNKMSMLNYTQILFQKILREEPDIELHKESRIENMINSLDEIAEREVYHNPLQVNKDFNLKQIEKRKQYEQEYEMKMRENYQKMMREQQLRDFYNSEDYGCNGHSQPQNTPKNYQLQNKKHEKQVTSSEQEVKIIQKSSQQHIRFSGQQVFQKTPEQYYQPSPLIFNKQSLKLDIRLDEVQFGKDHYDNLQKDQHKVVSTLSLQASNVINHKMFKSQNSEKLKEPTQQLNLNFKKINDEQFISISQQNNKIFKIPMLMTKDRLQQLQIQKTAKEVQMINVYMKNKQSFQLSQVNIQGQHFTTLIDVNQFVMQFYEFLMKVQLQQTIDGLNVPYGKSCVDKLRILKKEGHIPVQDNNNVLKRSYLDNFHNQFQLHIRRLTQYQRTHNMAIFDAFNSGLNVYRPFFELQGQVYPWTTSEKGLTFYEISEDNIEQVFEKSKMSILEHCASLCGLIPGCETTTQQARNILQKRNKECYQRILKAQIIQRCAQWSIHKINFQTLFRLNLSQQIFHNQLQLLFKQLSKLKQR